MGKVLFDRARWFMRGVQVIALVGKSGTGKSFRARLVAERRGVDLIIDDGLLIRGDRILAGKSAKREDAYLGAVRTAIFADAEHRESVRRAIQAERFKRILILGTSERMVRRIAGTLKLPQPHELIQIEDVASADEIDLARHTRKSHGSHVIPVPSIEVRKTYPKMVADSVRVIFRSGFGLFGRRKTVEKAVVRPAFSQRGSVTITESAIAELIMHATDEYAPGSRVKRLVVRNSADGYEIQAQLHVPPGSDLVTRMHELQASTVRHLEQFTGIVVKRLDILVAGFVGDEGRR